jgi:hypothetical protein
MSWVIKAIFVLIFIFVMNDIVFADTISRVKNSRGETVGYVQKQNRITRVMDRQWRTIYTVKDYE